MRNYIGAACVESTNDTFETENGITSNVCTNEVCVLTAELMSSAIRDFHRIAETLLEQTNKGKENVTFDELWDAVEKVHDMYLGWVY